MKRLTTLLYILCLLTCINFYSCHDTQTVIKGCCDEPAASEQVGVGWVWVPNVFTPNGDGIHDRMLVYGDSMIDILHLRIWNKDNTIVFNSLHIPFNDYSTGWDGTVNGRVEKGLYKFTMDVEAIDHTVKTIKGHICNCPCDQMGDEDLKPISNCEFGLCDPQFIDCVDREFLPCFKY